MDITDILETGIQAKRQGNYKQALENYKKAQKIAPNDYRIYGNAFRVLIGLEKYDEALRNLMVVASFNRIDRLIDKDLLDPLAKSMFNQFRSRFNSSSVLYNKGFFNKVKYEPELITDAIKNDELLNDLIFRADNLTYYIGHAFIGLNPKILSSHNIPISGFKNLNNSLLGKPTGNDLREHKTAGLFLCVGFIFAYLNFRIDLDTKEKVVEYYLDSSNSLNYDLTSFRNYINKQSSRNVVKKSFEQEKEKLIENEFEIDEFSDDLRESLVGKWRIPDEEMKNIFQNEQFENIWGQKVENGKYTLFLMINTNEDSIGLGDSLERNYYHCELKRLILTEGTYNNDLPCGNYEFEIINIPQLDFSHRPDKRHLGKIFYMDRNSFDELFVIPIYMEDIYDNQLRNTIGLENTKFG